MKNNVQRKFETVSLRVATIFVLVISTIVGVTSVSATSVNDNATANRSAPMKQITAQAQISDQIARFQEQATKAGYVVQEGKVGLVELDEMYCNNTLWTSDYPNPNSPYIGGGVPPVPGQEPTIALPSSFRLREDEAVVVIGITPPQMAYFGLNFHMLRGSMMEKIGPPILWIPVTDPVNNLTLRKTGPTPFNQPFAVVATGHWQTQDRVHQMLRAAGLGAVTNDQVISPSLFHLGLGPGSDEFAFAMRTALPESKSDLDGYLERLDNDDPAARPVHIFRVRPKSVSDANQIEPVLSPDPLPVPPLRVAGTGRGELDLTPTLQLLRQRIIDKHPGYRATDIRVDPWFDDPYPGLQRNMITVLPGQDGVDGATSDALYLATPNFTLPGGAFLVAYGAHHRATGKATYSSVSVYADAAVGAGLVTVQSPDLQSSARDYINDQPNADMFYAWTFTRASSNDTSHTTQVIPTTDFCKTRYPGTDRPVDLNTLRVGYRAYIEPTTAIHPSQSEILFDHLLLFTPK